MQRTSSTCETTEELIEALRKVETFIFDFDGTLADTESVHFLAYNETLRTLGSSLGLEEFKTYLGKETGFVYDRIKRNRRLRFDDSVFLAAKTKSFLKLSERMNLRCFEYFLEVVEAYPDAPTFIVSAQDRTLILELLERWKFDPLFQDVLTTSESGSKRQCIGSILDLTGIASSRTAYFEDSSSNIALGNDLGLKTVGIKTNLNGDATDDAALVIDVRSECYALDRLSVQTDR